MERLEQIIVATLELAAESGLGNVSLQRIADKVGIRKASLFNHIENKDDLLDKMYSYLRDKALNMNGEITLDFSKNAEDILLDAYYNYLAICKNDNLNRFYKLIYSERCFNSKAKELVIEETNRMVEATTSLFLELERLHKLKLNNVRVEAIAYAFTIHNFIDYTMDIEGIKSNPTYRVEEYIHYFVEVHHA